MIRFAASPLETNTNVNRLPWRRARLASLVVALALGVASCTNFFYNRLDTLAAWYIQDLVSLDDDQRSNLRSWLEGTLQWHRKSELMRYVQFLRDLSGAAARPGDPTTYQTIESQVETFGSRLSEKQAIQYFIQQTEAFFQRHSALLDSLGQRVEIHSGLDAVKKNLATLSPEPTGEKVEPRENVPFTKPKNVKG